MGHPRKSLPPITPLERRNAELVGEVERLTARVANLLNSNNAEVDRRRTAERELATAKADLLNLGDGLLAMIRVAANLRGRAERAERVVHSILRTTFPPIRFGDQLLSSYGKVGRHAAQ